MTAVCREMRIADICATLKLRQSTIENAITIEELERDYNVTPQAIGAVMQAGDQAGWVCEEGGRVVGFAMGAIYVADRAPIPL